MKAELILKPASVSGRRAEEVAGGRRDDFRNGAGTQRRRRPLTEADAAAFPQRRSGRADGK